jgi:phosphatidylglycerophosphate synthase
MNELLDWRARVGELTTVPNLVSLSRLPLVALVVVFLDSPLRYPLFALVVVSDGIDGWLARRLDQTTELGALLDPALDKFAALALFIALFPRTGLPWEYVVLFFARDAFVVSLGALVPVIDEFDPGKVRSRLLGKLATNVQFLATVAMLVPNVPATALLFWLLGAVSALAIADYVVFAGRELTDEGPIHTAGGAALVSAGVLVAFALLVAVILPDELRSALAVLG